MVFWRHKYHLVKLRMCCHPRWPALQVRTAIVSYINSSFLAKFLLPVREYRVQSTDVTLLKTITLTKSSRPRDRGNYKTCKESAACPITKASNSSHFHIPLSFCSLLSQPCSIRYFVSMPFLILKINKNVFSIESLYHKDSNMFRPLNKVKPCSARLVFGWVTKYEYPVL